MTDKPRELTTLEYIILGLLSIQPQSGYAILNIFETGIYRWSASAGSIYPVLKRLEKLGLITSVLEFAHEARPRKVYTLAESGGEVLDMWLRVSPTVKDIIEEHDIVLHKFLFAEKRLSRAEVLDWLEAYRAIAQSSADMYAMIARNVPLSEISLHQQLVNDSIRLTIEARLTWIDLACQHLKLAESSAD